MGWIELAGNIFKLVFLLLSKFFDWKKERKVIKGEAADMVTDGIKTRDRSKITAGFSRLKNS